MISPELFTDILGWRDSTLYLLVYGLVFAKRAEGDSFLYQSTNIFAGMWLVIYTLSLGGYVMTGLNAFWVAIDLLNLGRKWLTRT